MQSDRDALLAGILADPDADLPRLVFADWLEETGHPANCARAEYIRLAIDLSRLACDDPNKSEFDGRLHFLKSIFHDEWDSFNGVPPELYKSSRARGFLCDLAIKIEYLSRIFCGNTFYPVQQLCTYGSLHRHEYDIAIILPASLQTLTLRESHSVSSILEYLFSGTDLCNFKALSIEGCSVSDDDVIELIHLIRANRTLGRIEYLRFVDEPITDRAAHALAAAHWPGGFKSLTLKRTRITNAGREVLFRRFGFEELRPRLALS